mgnify:CR=1 FL=1
MAGQPRRALRAAASAVVVALPIVALVGLGGAPPPVLAACLSLVALGVLAASARPRVAYFGPAELGLALSVMWMAVSIAPLPEGLLRGLAPATGAVWGEGFAASGLPWGRASLSLAPGDTSVAVARTGLVLASLLFLRLLGRETTRALVHRTVFALGAVLVGIVALHAIASPSAIYGVVDAVRQDFSPILGPFTNTNDLAVAACALLPVTAVDALRFGRLPRVAAALLSVALGAVAILSLSRAASLGIFVGVGVLGGGLVLARQWRNVGAILGGAALSLVCVAGGVAQITTRVEHLLRPSLLLQFDGRFGIWSTAWAMTREHWATGVGARAFGAVWWGWREAPTEVFAQDAEGLVPELMATLGIPMTLTLLALAATALGSAAVAARRAAADGDLVPLGALAGLYALVSMSMVTMTTTQPAISLIAVYLFVLTGTRLGRTVRARRTMPALVLTTLAVAGAALVWSGPRTGDAVDEWFRERVLADAVGVEGDAIAQALWHPSDPYGFSWAAILHRNRNPSRALSLVNRAMALDPHGAEPHRAAANVLLANGLRDQSLGEIRLALAGATRAELEGFIADALRLFPEDSERLRLIPLDPDAAVRVVRGYAVGTSPSFHLTAWLHVARRPLPPFEAVRVAVALAPPERRAEVMAVARSAREARPDDPRFGVLEAELAFKQGQTAVATALLEEYLDAPGTDDVWRAHALMLLGDDLLPLLPRRPEALRGLLARASEGGNSEEAVRAWLRAEVHLAEGAISLAVRELSEATRRRPDIPRFSRRLSQLREGNP